MCEAHAKKIVYLQITYKHYRSNELIILNIFKIIHKKCMENGRNDMRDKMTSEN